MQSKSSEMIRVVKVLIPAVKSLNDLCRDGHADEIMLGLNHLITTIERGESLPSYAALDQKLQVILEKLDQVPAAAPIGTVQQPAANNQRQVARAAAPAGQVKQKAIATPQTQDARAAAPAAPTVMIYLSSEGYSGTTFKTPVGEHHVKCGVWSEIPLSWLPMIQDQVQKSNHYQRSGFRLEVAG
jgi:hypothetical protein